MKLESRIVRAVHPHWCSDLYLSLEGNIVWHRSSDVTGSYSESGRFLSVSWPDDGSEEFVSVDQVYYHASLLHIDLSSDQHIASERQIAEEQTEEQPGLASRSKDRKLEKHYGARKNSHLLVKSRFASLIKLLLTSHDEHMLHHTPECICTDLPTVSVIVPTRNRSKLLREAMESICAQRYDNIEVVIVDDDSTDDTQQVADEFVARIRVKYVKVSCGKSTIARNAGLRHATGTYIAYLDDDNLWLPNFIGSAISYLESNRTIDLVYGILVFDEGHTQDNLYLFDQYSRDKLRKSNYIDTNVIVHRTSLIQAKIGWDENLSRLSDWDFILSHTSHENTKGIPVLACFYRTCAENRISVSFKLEESAQYIQHKHKLL